MVIVPIMYILVALISTYVVGIPLTYYSFLNGKDLERNTREKANVLYALSPIIGLSAIVMLLKILVCLNIPIQYSAVPVFIGGVILFIWFCFKMKNKRFLWKIFVPAPSFIFAFAIVFFAVSFGYVFSQYEFYKGYYWEDLSYYIPQAEMVRTLPFSEFESQTSPFVEMGTLFIGGQHRISIGIMLAYFASLFGKDASVAIGPLMVLFNLMIFGGVYLVTSRVKLRNWVKYATWISVSLLPGVVLTKLEGFVSVLFFVAFLLFFVAIVDSIYSEIQDKNIWLKGILLGLVIANTITVLLDGVFMILAILGMSWLAVIFNGKNWTRYGLALLLSSAIACIGNIFFAQAIVEELQWNLARDKLNFIFPYAYSKDIINRMLFGTVFGEQWGFVGVIFSLIAILLLIAGIFGVLYCFLFKKSFIGFLMSLCVVVPAVFYAQEDDASYAIYKVVTLVVPFVIIGIWKFWNICCDKLTDINTEKLPRISVALHKITFWAGSGTILCVFVFSIISSLYKESRVLASDFNPTEDTRVQHLSSCYTSETLEMYNQIQSSEKSLLFVVSPYYDLCAKWMSYYGRSNKIYFLNDYQAWSYQTNVEEIPLDADIYYSSLAPKCVDDAYTKVVAAQMSCEKEGEKYIPTIWEEVSSTKYTLEVFSKEDLNVTITLVMGTDSTEKTVNFAGKSYAPQDGKITVEAKLKVGMNQLNFEQSDSEAYSLRDWFISVKK